MTRYSCTAVIGRIFAGKLCRGGPSRDSRVEVESQHPRSASTNGRFDTFPVAEALRLPPVHHLDDDSLLVILSFCRPVILDESDVDNGADQLDGGKWNRERWWYGLIQVCRRWRYLVLQSGFHLQVSLVCGRGTPVAAMLAHYSPFPLIIDHIDEKYDVLAPEDEKGIIFALQHRDRVRRIRIRKSNSILQRLVIALDGEFPVLEHLAIENRRFTRPLIDCITNLNLPETFRAPHLHELMLDNFTTPIESPILATTGNLVTHTLCTIPSTAYFHPNVLLQRFSLMPQLETLGIGFNCYNPRHERQLLRTPIMTQVTLPNLRVLFFDGTNAYLEAFLPWVSTPHLERLSVHVFNRVMYSIPHLRQFSAAGKLRLNTAMFTFGEYSLDVHGYPHREARLYTLSIGLGGKHLDWQVVSAAQVFPELKTLFSVMEHLFLNFNRRGMSSEWNRQADRTHWRELLGSFDKVKTLCVEGSSSKSLALYNLVKGNHRRSCSPSCRSFHTPAEAFRGQVRARLLYSSTHARKRVAP